MARPWRKPESSVAATMDYQHVRTDSFNDLIHDLRSMALTRAPAGARIVYSGGCSGGSYFDWFNRFYPTPVETHFGIEKFVPRPESLPAEVEWHAHSLGEKSSVTTGAVDLVFAGQVIEHLWDDDVVGFLVESHRVLRPGGHLVLDSPNRRITRATDWVQPEHTVEFTPREIELLLGLAGFEDIAIQGLWLCYSSEEDRLLGLPPHDGGSEWPWQRRASAATNRPEDSFIWWAQAARGPREPDESALTSNVREIFREVYPGFLRRTLHDVGSVEERPGGHSVATAPAGVAGALLYGPYAPLPPGKYAVSFMLHIEDGDLVSPSSEDVRCTLDVISNPGQQKLAECEVAVADLPRDSDTLEVSLSFELASTAFGVEFRVISTGLGQVGVRCPPRLTVHDAEPDHPVAKYLNEDPDSPLRPRGDQLETGAESRLAMDVDRIKERIRREAADLETLEPIPDEPPGDEGRRRHASASVLPATIEEVHERLAAREEEVRQPLGTPDDDELGYSASIRRSLVEADAVADVGAAVPGFPYYGATKRLVARFSARVVLFLAGIITAHQRVFNRSIQRATAVLLEELERRELADLHLRRDVLELRQELARLRAELAYSADRLSSREGGETDDT